MRVTHRSGVDAPMPPAAAGRTVRVEKGHSPARRPHPHTFITRRTATGIRAQTQQRSLQNGVRNRRQCDFVHPLLLLLRRE